MNCDDAFLDWLAGFTAGEGCFTIVEHLHAPYPPSWSGQFCIRLRDDDIDILFEIQERLEMGVIYRCHTSNPLDKPQAAFQVSRIRDCMRLVEMFEGHGIRAKKQRDFEIWSQAVKEIWHGRAMVRGKANTTTYNKEKLQFLKNRLTATKKYSARLDDPEDMENLSESCQLSIWPGSNKDD